MFGLQHPLSLFQAAFPPLLSAMLPSAATTSPTSPSAGGDPASEQPAGADPPLENKRNKQSTRSVSDTLQWCIGENCCDHLSLVDRDGEGQAGKLYCTICGVWLSAKGAIIKDHCFGKNKKGEDGTFRRHPGFHATKAAAALAKPPPAPPAQPETQAQPTIIVNVTTPTKHGETLSPPAKKMKVDQSGSVVAMLNRGTAGCGASVWSKGVDHRSSSLLLENPKILITYSAAACRSMPQHTARMGGDYRCLPMSYTYALAQSCGLSQQRGAETKQRAAAEQSQNK